MKFKEVCSAEDIVALTEELGFLPFFANSIRGFSIEERCPSELWFVEGRDGPWEWKGPAAKSGRCVYGKFFQGKAGFVSREWFPILANYRRDGYDFDARYDDGLASRKDKAIVDALSEHGPLLSKELKKLCNYRKGGNKGFDTVIARLSMQTYVVVADFVYMQDKAGRPYGWGVAEYALAETLLGRDFVTSAYDTKPTDSREKIFAHLQKALPQATEAQLRRLLG